MSTPEDVDADMLAFWNGAGGHTWVKRQAHTDAILEPVTEALLKFAAPRAGERVLDVGCGCGAATLALARAVGPQGSVAAFDISEPMLTEGKERARASFICNVEWRQGDAATAKLRPYDLLTSAFGVMFFGDPVAAFAHMREAAAPEARMAFVCWGKPADNPWMEVPMKAVARHLPPRPERPPNAPGMFAFSDPDYVRQMLTAAGWATPEFQKLRLDLDLAAGRGLDAAIEQTTQIGAVHSWLRDQPEAVVAAAVASLREALAEHANGDSVRLPSSMWLVRSR